MNSDDGHVNESIPHSPIQQKSGIQAIDKDAVHKICSGQVVLNLATAVKELVENSLDAGATSIEIKLKEYGSELVEVVDNGSGVEDRNLEGLTLKHHTSKLRDFTDLLDVETFGFRGEALSSLCALSEMTVFTRHSSSNMGTKLTFDSRGHILSKTPCARQVGTTVSLINLFSPLPVRQKEFLRNLKREFYKMTQLLYAYCLISRGVKIICTNQCKKGPKTNIASTQGSLSYKGNITCIFGAKQTSSLLDLEQIEPLNQHLEEVGLKNNSEDGSFVLEGCISSCAHGQGRSTPDRQFYYINNRPCEPTKVVKVVNEIYHQFNFHQYPFVFMNIKTERSAVDVNVTPDKRQIFLEYEKLLLATVKATLLSLFENIPSTFEFNNVSIAPSKSPIKCSRTHSSDVSTQASNSSETKFTSLLKNFKCSSVRTVEKKDACIADLTIFKSKKGVKRCSEGSPVSRDGRKQLRLSAFVLTNTSSDLEDKYKGNNSETQLKMSMDSSEVSIERDDLSSNCSYVNEQQSKTHESPSAKVVEESHLKAVSLKTSAREEQGGILQDNACFQNYDKEETESFVDITPEEAMEENHSWKEDHSSPTTVCSFDDSSKDVQNIVEDDQSLAADCSLGGECDMEVEALARRVIFINVSLDSIKEKCEKKLNSSQKMEHDDLKRNGPLIRFYSDIDPSKNKSAEAELQKEISKDMFSKMKIVGQFNLGFIITLLGPDLFIIDQHATDEKYNFEMLQMHTTLQNQKLIVPQSLDLTAANEAILLENLDIFLKNGFNFSIDKDADPGKRVRLTTKPISHNWEFGKEDIDELLFMLEDSPNTMCRPSRVRAMFASRACRKSVMIGTALSKSAMRQLINHMGEIEQPWNCPHGRPTMRHLINLELLVKKK